MVVRNLHIGPQGLVSQSWGWKVAKDLIRQVRFQIFELTLHHRAMVKFYLAIFIKKAMTEEGTMVSELLNRRIDSDK